MEEEAWLGETVIKESEYTADVELASKKGDNRLYGIRVLEPDEVITEGQVDIFELIPAAGFQVEMSISLSASLPSVKTDGRRNTPKTLKTK